MEDIHLEHTGIRRAFPEIYAHCYHSHWCLSEAHLPVVWYGRPTNISDKGHKIARNRELRDLNDHPNSQRVAEADIREIPTQSKVLHIDKRQGDPEEATKRGESPKPQAIENQQPNPK